MGPVSVFFRLALVMVAGLSLAWSDSWDEIKAAAGSVTSVQSSFVQKKHLPILVEPLVSKGNLSFQSPASLRWEYTAPVQSILLMHKGRIRRFTKTAEGFSEESGAGLDAMQVVLDQITHWLTGRFDDNGMFAPSLEPGGKIILKPRQEAMGAVIQHIELYLGKQPGVIQRVLIYEGPDAYTELVFSGTTLNQTLDESLFQNVP